MELEPAALTKPEDFLRCGLATGFKNAVSAHHLIEPSLVVSIWASSVEP